MHRSRVAEWLILACVVSAMALPVHAMALQNGGTIRGMVADPLGARLPATLALYRIGERVAGTTTNENGEYAFTRLEAGRYQVEAAAPGFETRISDPVFVGSSGELMLDMTLQIGPLQQEISVTAAATELPVARVGAPVSVIDRDLIEQLGKPDVLEALRTVPGLSVVQTGARGGTTSIFLRGGEADFNKVLVDGAPANDIGGSFSFDAMSTTAVDSVEVLRTANSVLYGADAMSGVVSVETRRGRSRVPELSYAIEGGNLGTIRNELSFGGVAGRFDYFADASRFDTDNDLPNNDYRNDTLATRVGYLLGSGTDISATLRRTETDFESPNGMRFFRIPDDSSFKTRLTYTTVAARSEWSSRLGTTFQYSYTERSTRNLNPSPSGEPFDPFGFGPNFLGNEVTITGENGFSTTGRAILDFSGPFPRRSQSNTKRHLFRGQADVEVLEYLEVSAGGRIEDESGTSTFASSPADRRNYGSFIEGRGNIGRRLYVTAGVGLENNEIFGYEAVPRMSLAFFARRPSPGAVGGTKLMFNIGKGIRAPSVFDEQSSLFAFLDGIPSGASLIDQFGIEPINAERTRTIDAGVEQEFWGSRIRARVSYFNNRNENLIEFVSNSVLPQLGVPTEVANQAGFFGATVNSASFDAQGVETSGEIALGNAVRLSGFYTFLDAEVKESFSGSALQPALNPALPDIPIGAFSPLVGERPFRRPTHSGGLTVSYTRGLAQVLVTGSFIGRQADSTFLSDAFFGNSMLLPNKDLSGNYQKIDLAGSYRIHPRVKWSAGIENLLDQDYDAAFGFPGLPITVRTGLTFTVGGDDY